MPRSVILFLSGDPARSSARAIDRECAAIERELAMTPARDELELRSKWAVTIDELMRHVLELSPEVLHFTGHGDPAGLVLADDEGRARPVAPAALSRIFEASPSARLAVLSGCYSDAQALALRASVGCVVGVGGSITDDVARAFAVGLYRALGHRRSVGNAYQQALAVLEGKGLGADIEPRCLVRPGVSADALRLGGDRPPEITAAPARSAPHPRVSVRYALFLAHLSSTRRAAHALYDLLQPDVRAFLDARSLRPEDRWDHAIPAAQRASRATVILISAQVSAQIDTGGYLGNEIATAIALHRAAPAAHTLIPVLLDRSAALPDGLRHVQAIDADAEGGLLGVALRLREIAAQLGHRDG